jgi:tetratricopeptide (TPR) repeat protein
VLVHPSYILVAAGVLVWLARCGLARAGAFALAAALVVAPISLKNLLVHGQPVLVSWSGGINFYVGNQPGYDQTSGQGTQAWERVLYSPEDAGIQGEAARDRYYYRLALRQMADDPLTAARILMAKLRTFLSPVEIANNFGIYELTDHSPLLRATLGRAGPFFYPLGILAPLAWIGAVLLARRGARGHGLILFFVAAIALTCVLFFNTSRYRLPAVFFGSIWVAAALEAGWRRVRERSWWRLGAGVSTAVVLGVFTAAIAVPQRALPPPLEFTEAQVLEGMGRHREAATLHERVCREHPDDAGLLLGAAAFHGRRGDPSVARTYLRRVLELRDLGPDDRSNAYESLAQSYVDQGRLNEAEVAYRSALEVRVDDATRHGTPFFRMGLGPVTACRLRLGLAEVALRRGDRPTALAIIADVLATCGAHGRIADRLRELEPL